MLGLLKARLHARNFGHGSVKKGMPTHNFYHFKLDVYGPEAVKRLGPLSFSSFTRQLGYLLC